MYRQDAEMLIKAGHQLPQPWQNPPEVESHLIWYFDAFIELSSCRSIGMSIGQIPWTAIVEYQDRYDLGDEKGFIRIIREMDQAYLTYVAEKK